MNGRMPTHEPTPGRPCPKRRTRGGSRSRAARGASSCGGALRRPRGPRPTARGAPPRRRAIRCRLGCANEARASFPRSRSSSGRTQAVEHRGLRSGRDRDRPDRPAHDADRGDRSHDRAHARGRAFALATDLDSGAGSSITTLSYPMCLKIRFWPESRTSGSSPSFTCWCTVFVGT